MNSEVALWLGDSPACVEHSDCDDATPLSQTNNSTIRPNINTPSPPPSHLGPLAVAGDGIQHDKSDISTPPIISFHNGSITTSSIESSMNTDRTPSPPIGDGNSPPILFKSRSIVSAPTTLRPSPPCIESKRDATPPAQLSESSSTELPVHIQFPSALSDDEVMASRSSSPLTLSRGASPLLRTRPLAVASPAPTTAIPSPPMTPPPPVSSSLLSRPPIPARPPTSPPTPPTPTPGRSLSIVTSPPLTPQSLLSTSSIASISANGSGDEKCELCARPKAATHRCMSCTNGGQWMCSMHAEGHQEHKDTQHHSVMPRALLAQFQRSAAPSQHPFTSYCYSHKEPFSADCASQHTSCNVRSLEESAKYEGHQIQIESTRCQAAISDVNTSLSKCTEAITTTQAHGGKLMAKIRTELARLRQALNEREQQLLDMVQANMDRDTAKHQEHITQIEFQLKQAISFQSLAQDLLGRGTPVEIVLQSEQIRRQLAITQQKLGPLIKYIPSVSLKFTAPELTQLAKSISEAGRIYTTSAAHSRVELSLERVGGQPTNEDLKRLIIGDTLSVKIIAYDSAGQICHLRPDEHFMVKLAKWPLAPYTPPPPAAALPPIGSGELKRTRSSSVHLPLHRTPPVSPGGNTPMSAQHLRRLSSISLSTAAATPSSRPHPHDDAQYFKAQRVDDLGNYLASIPILELGPFELTVTLHDNQVGESFDVRVIENSIPMRLELKTCRGLADHKSVVYVADEKRVQVIDSVINEVTIIGESPEVRFTDIGGMCMSQIGELYVLDVDRIQVFTSTGSIQRTLLHQRMMVSRSRHRQPNTTTGDICISSRNWLYVLDHNKNQLLRVDPVGKPKTDPLDTLKISAAAGGVTVVTQEEGDYGFIVDGTLIRQFVFGVKKRMQWTTSIEMGNTVARPIAIHAVKDQIFVCDEGNSVVGQRIQVYDIKTNKYSHQLSKSHTGTIIHYAPSVMPIGDPSSNGVFIVSSLAANHQMRIHMFNASAIQPSL